MKASREYDRITPRVAALSASQVHELVLDYVERRLMPKPQRGDQKVWARERGITATDIYGVLQRAGHEALVGGDRQRVLNYATEHGLLREQQEPTTEVVISHRPTTEIPMVGVTLDGALLEAMIRAEIARVVTSLRGEVEQHVRKETQAAVERELERVSNTLLRSLASTLDAAIGEMVEKALEAWTS